MDHNPYLAPAECESTAVSTVEPWRKFTIAAAIVTVVSSLGIVVMVLVNFLLFPLGNPSYLWVDILSALGTFLCLAAPLGLLAWTFGSVFLLRARRRERSDSSSPP